VVVGCWFLVLESLFVARCPFSVLRYTRIIAERSTDNGKRTTDNRLYQKPKTNNQQ
jgi:hypothetical protein